jgi:GT2 family glycosyltransferase
MTAAPSESAGPLLAAVIVARNEEAFLGACLESVLEAGDRTPDIVRRFPVTAARVRDGVRCTAALARAAGQAMTRSRYLLFVDGDTAIEADWLRQAVALLEATPDVAGVAGKLREVYYRDGRRVGATDDFFRMGSAAEEAYQLGGNAVYRRAALDAVGGFHAGVISHEEAELAARLRQAGHRLMRLPATVGTHHTGARDTFGECWRRFRSGLNVGYGQVLRLTVGTALFRGHARALNRYLACLGFLALGVVAAGLTVLGRPAPALVWLGAAGLVCAAFALRAGSVRRPATVLADWVLAAPGIVWGFAVGPLTVAGTPETLVDVVQVRPEGAVAAARGGRRC